jgi:hypothetical protein
LILLFTRVFSLKNKTHKNSNIIILGVFIFILAILLIIQGELDTQDFVNYDAYLDSIGLR